MSVTFLLGDWEQLKESNVSETQSRIRNYMFVKVIRDSITYPLVSA